MRRLLSKLAAGLLAAGTVLAAGGAASAAPAAVGQLDCSDAGYAWVTAGSVSYYLGTPNKASSGSAAILKPKENSTTFWLYCQNPASPGPVVLEQLSQDGALTSRSSSPGSDVTMEPVGNGGNGFASQQWVFGGSSGFLTFQNVKTGLFLRVRNSGPVMGQTVTTGSTPTDWSG